MVFKKLYFEEEKGLYAGKKLHLPEIPDMRLLYFFLLLPAFTGTAQNRFTSIAEESEFLSGADDLQKFSSYDFSPLIKEREDDVCYGTIGDAYKRIRIRITEVTKDVQNPNLYHIKGKSKVGNNREDFAGTLKLEQVRPLKAAVRDGEKAPGYEGVVRGTYEFREPEDRMHSGIFEGTYEGRFLITPENRLVYHDLDLSKDAYFNNAYRGFWTDYTTHRAKVCKWADFRVPDVPYSFDSGAGEFVPSEQYNDKGWKSYRDAVLNNDAKAREEEQELWWQ